MAQALTDDARANLIHASPNLALKLRRVRESAFQALQEDPCAENFLIVKNAPVNYAFRSSGPVTTSPPAVSGMVSESPHLPARCSARYKCSLVPRRFSLQLPPSFPPPFLCPARLLLPRRASLALQTILRSCGPQPTVTTGPMRKMAQHAHLRAFASCPAIPFRFRSPLCLFAHPSIPPSPPAAWAPR